MLLSPQPEKENLKSKNIPSIRLCILNQEDGQFDEGSILDAHVDYSSREGQPEWKCVFQDQRLKKPLFSKCGH